MMSIADEAEWLAKDSRRAHAVASMLGSALHAAASAAEAGRVPPAITRRYSRSKPLWDCVSPQMLAAAFVRSQPGIDIELDIGNREDTSAAFKAGRLDVAVMGRLQEGVEVKSALIGDHPQVMIAPPHHRLAKQRAIPRQILPAKGC